MAKKKYGEDDYLAMCDARDCLREIIDVICKGNFIDNIRENTYLRK